ncbi:MAG: arginine--tRNA ligase, partial [Clostridia bacterium]|nr:arginine--tRNA ligase [Clostridia bacterium]
MNILKDLEKEFSKIFEELGYPKEDINITFSDRPELCDFQCNSSFILAKKEKKAPIMIANAIVEKINNDNYTISIANPGFINITLKEACRSKIIKELYNDERVGIEKV